MLARAAQTGRILARLLELGCSIAVRRDSTRVTVAVINAPVRARYYDGGTLDACVEQIDPETFAPPGRSHDARAHWNDAAAAARDSAARVSRGGTGDDSNLQTLCRECNAGKGARAPHHHDFIQ